MKLALGSRWGMRAGATLALALTLAGAALADLKIVSKTTTSGSLGMMGPMMGLGNASGKKPDAESTAYYKGDKIRTETGDTVQLLDIKTGVVTMLDSRAKTYTVLDPEKMASQGPAAQMREWSLNISISMKPGGPFEGEIAQIKVDGEQWASDEVKLTSTEPIAIAPYRGLLKMIPDAMKIVGEKMATIHGFPLATATTTKITILIPGAPGGDQKPLVQKTEVVSVSDETLADSLFAVPDGYKEKPLELPVPGQNGVSL